MLETAADAVHRSTTASVLARAGLVARTGFYLLLSWLVLRLLLADPHPQANASGALQIVGRGLLGKAALAVAALGFLAYGVSRLLGAVRDRAGSRLARGSTALQGLFYVGLTEVPCSYLLGRHSTGSEQQQHSTTAHLLRLPEGRVLLAAAGLVLIGVCAWQVRTAVRSDFTDSLRTEGCSAWVRRLVRVVGRIGIPARALVFAPIGGFLVLAAVRSDPSAAKGLNAELGALARTSYGRALLAAVVLALLSFTAYSAIEAKYRDVDAGH